jgi:hypothetical protein
MGRVDSWSRYKHFSLDFLDFPCDTNTMNIVLNALSALTACDFSVRLQEAVGRSHATELAMPVIVHACKSHPKASGQRGLLETRQGVGVAWQLEAIIG